MTLLSASFEVSPSGAAIPLSGGTDAFAAGKGFNGTGTSFVSDSSVAAAVASGSYAAKITVGSTAAQSYRGWSWSGGVVHVRQFVYLTGSPNARFTFWENYSSSTFLSRIRINTDRTAGVGTSSTVWLTTAPIPLNTLVRIEASFSHAAGTMSLDLYLGHSSTPITDGSVAVTGVSFPATTVSNVYGGVLSTLTNYTIRTDAWAVSDVARVGPIVASSTIAGVTPMMVVQAAGGSVSGGTGGPKTVTGVTPVMIVQAGNRPVPPLPPSLGVWPPDPYRDAIRSGGTTLVYTVDASLGGVPVAGATGLRPTGGSIVDTTKPGVRRVLNLELAPEPGLFDKLSPIGTQLTVTATVTYLNRTTQDIPMGVFEVDSEKLSEGGGGLTLTAPDKWARVQRARFLMPMPSRVHSMVVDQIVELIQTGLGTTEAVRVSASSLAQMGPMVWEKDRDKAIIDLANGIGAWVYFDRDGICTVVDQPTTGESADWLIDSSATGVLTALDRERSRTGVCNVVVVEYSGADEGGAFNTQVVWDDDPTSPTYAGPDPVNRPDLAGPFGVVVDYLDIPLPLGDTGARMAGLARLARVAGLASQVSLGQVPNPAVDAFAVIDVFPPQERYDIARVLERHIADTVTHPLTVDQEQHIEGRSTRTEELTGGS